MNLYENDLNLFLDDIITDEEIQNLVNQLSLQYQPLEETPDDIESIKDVIESIKDVIERNRLLNDFNLLNEIYVLPLLEMANRISNRLTGQRKIFVGIDDFSIRKRMAVIRKYLIDKGVSENTILELIPKTVSEVNVLVAARKSGFLLEFGDADSLSNKDRVMRASEHLKQLSENIEHKSK